MQETSLLNFEKCDPPSILEGCIDKSFGKTIFNHFENPLLFMDAVKSYKDHKYCSSKSKREIEDGVKAFEKIGDLNTKYDTLFQDVSEKVRGKLLARGFTTAMLYSSVEFTTENTGVMSKQRAMLGRRDCYFKNPSMSDGKLFHDMYINLSYSWGVSDATIRENSYAIYALTKELARVLPMRVIVVNHVGTDIPTCYSYVLKKFGMPLNPEEFLFFTSASKRTFGWATYGILNKGDSDGSTVGRPENSVSIDKFNLDREIDRLFEKITAQAPELFKAAS